MVVLIGGRYRPPNTQRRLIMIKTLIAVLILATASIAATSNGNAGPSKQYPTQEETNWMERASKTFDGGAI